MKSRVVVTGLGHVTPLGLSVDRVWEDVCLGKSGIRALASELHLGFRSKIAGYCVDFSPENCIEPKDVKKIDRFSQFALSAAKDAVTQSGIDFSQENPYRCAAIIGSGVGGLSEIEINFEKLLGKGASRVSPFTIPKMMSNAAGGHISIRYGLHGPSFAVSSACASSNDAVSYAMQLIRHGVMDVVITGGSEAALTRLGLAGFCAMHALSEQNNEPEKASRPFDRNRVGFVLSEGSGIVVLESLEHAKTRKAKILAEMLGCGASSDATHITQPNEDGSIASSAMQNALNDAKLNGEQIEYINAHGTGTILGDIAETNALKRVFGDFAYKIPISSTKSQLGHLLGASGGVELIFCIKAIETGVIPPTINLDDSDPKCDLDYTPNRARETKLNYVLSNSFGFGGHNSTLIIGRYQD
ncbi:MAG: beta-ketoacyl-ACP synthase II [Planctomycetaceae bacterium]|jgi:3-oxoacyl-[acyl-carrier-protein] synthase II|nr:beta-ketoacyl-ACP synthase II [Planctomycetaceae bacterium]